MKLHAGFVSLLMELCSRMQVCISICLLPQMTSLLCSLILLGSTVSSPLGLENVFFSPQDETIKEGEAVFFQCVSGESSPPANITWLKDGKMVTRGRQFQGEYGGGQQKKTSSTLHLFNVTLEDDGIYICVTHNPLLNISKESKPAKLTVQGVPGRLQIIQSPDNITVAMGAEVSMRCTVHGFPVPMVHWFKDGCLLSNCSASFSLQNNGQLLTFRNVTKEDEGSYHCEASNQKETIRSQPAFLLPAEMHWSFVQQPTNMTVRRGETVTLTCRPPRSRPGAQVSWFKNNQFLSPTENRTVLPSGDLFFHSTQESDSGTYFCRASNIHLQRFLTSRRAILTVLVHPSVKIWPTVLTVPVGAQAVLECQVSGHPLPSISWVKRGHSKQTGGRISLGQKNATLHIQSARSYDEAVYVCEASNVLGKSQSSALLRVAVSPIILTSVTHMSCKLGAPVILPCRAVGIHPITYSWTRGRAETQSISPSEDKHVDDGSLHISSVQNSDAGEYFCTAQNRAGRHQRRTVLTVTAADHPDDRGMQTRQILSNSTNTNREHKAEQNLPRAPHPLVLAQQRKTTCFSCNSTIVSPKEAVTDRDVFHQTISPTQPFVTQMQPPILPPPPHPNFQSTDLHHQLPLTRKSLFISKNQPPVTHNSASEENSEVLGATLRYLCTDSQTLTSSSTPFHDQINKESFLESNTESEKDQITNMLTFQSSLKSPESGPSGFLKIFTPTPTQSPATQTKTRHSVTLRFTSEATSNQSKPNSLLHTKSPISHQNTFTQMPQTKQTHSQPLPHQPFTLNFSPKFHLDLSTLLPPTQPPPPSVSEPLTLLIYGQSSTTASFSTISPYDHDSSVLDSEVSWSNQQNTTQLHNNTDKQRKNTSQSPMTSNDLQVTQQSPSWLPVLEKHDVPIVVGVGVSLAFIFITVTFYSVVQKNEPTPTGRAAQRNFGLSVRPADRRAAGRTYENRAFEDDDCITVIEQSPNTSDTRARPPGPSLVTVQMEPTVEEVQDVPQPAVEHHSVTVETYPEPIVDTEIDLSLEDDKRCSLSQPSIQLQCAEDWTSNTGDKHNPCQDALPPPSSLPSPSLSPPSRRDDTLHSSLTFQSAESPAAPVHHSLSISHGNPPLQLSHHLCLGLTTVAVDVQFYPSATASTAVNASTHISSVSNSTSVTVPLFTPPLFNSKESDDQSTARFHQSK